MSSPVTRPIMRYFGGKWRLAPWIIEHLPAHQIYVEPFGGAGSVLLKKPRSYAEVYNDLDGEVVNVFLMARERGDELARMLTLTPFARVEYDRSYEPTDDPLERARRTIIRAFMGFGADSVHARYKTGFRSNSNRSGSTPAHDWMRYPDALASVVERLRGVVIECKEAAACMKQHDGPRTLHYVDPPYVPDARSRSGVHTYRHELDDEDHLALLGFLRELEGLVVVSGYASPLYDMQLHDWGTVATKAHADGGLEREERLWISPRAFTILQENQPKGIFG